MGLYMFLEKELFKKNNNLVAVCLVQMLCLRVRRVNKN